MSTGHISFVRSTRRQLPRSMPGQRPGTVGRGPTVQSISSPRSLRFAAWSSAAPLAGGPGRSASSSLRPRAQAASSSAQRQMWRSLGARSMLDARSFMISTLRSQVYPRSASPRPLRMPASASRVSSSSGALAAPPAVTRLPRAPSFRRPPSSRRGEALWGQSGWRQGRVRWGRPLLSRPRGAVGSGPAAVESAAVSAVAWCSGFHGWL